MEKSQSPAQVQASNAAANAQQMPLQISPEHFQQLQQQFQLQQAFGSGATIHVKQEYPNQQQANQQAMAAELKSQLENQAGQMQQLQQMQIVESNAPQSPHQNSQNNQNAMQLQQAVQAGQVQDWQHGRVQVLQQPIQNAYNLQQMYNPTQLVISPSGNLIQSGLGPQQIQLIAAGKPFQGGQITPQMLTTAQGKQVLSGTPASFGGTYALGGTIPNQQSQTVLFSPMGLVQQPQQTQQQTQQSIMPSMQQQGTPTKNSNMQDGQKQMSGTKVMQKVAQGNSNQQSPNNAANQQQSGQCVQVTQTMPTAQIINPLHQSGAQTMQFASPWGSIQGQFWTAANGIQPQTLLASNQIFIRGTNPDGSPGMFLQQVPQQQQSVQSPQNPRKYFSF